MKCPVCSATDLVMSERSGIEIDYCPQCRGVWLDRGELDKLIERSVIAVTAVTAVAAADAGRVPQHIPGYENKHQWGHSARHHDHGHHLEHGRSHHGKKSFWQEIFD